jgi:hypothetical protein
MIDPNANLSNFDNNDPQMLVEFIKQDPRYHQLVKLVQQGKPLPPEIKTGWQKVISLLIADPKDFHGTAKVTKELKREAANTANMNTLANWLDFASNFPLYLYSFKSFGGILGFTLALLVSGITLSICNVAASTASNRQKHNISLSNKAVGVMIALNIVKSLFSGIGIELSLNQSGLNQQMANQLIEEQIVRVEKLKKLDDPQYHNTLKRCEDGRKELEKMGRKHPRRDSLYQELFGSWPERDRAWEGVPLEQVPICKRIERLEQQAYAAYQAAKDTLNQKLVRRADLGNDLAFLKEEMPQVYLTKFTDRGDISTSEITSGTDAVAIATVNFFGKLIRGEWGSLGISLFFFSLSVITSAAAVLMTIEYAKREDVKKSRDEEIAQKRDEWLEGIWRELVQRRQQKLDKLKSPDEFSN